eukprot:gene2271-2574_t
MPLKTRPLTKIYKYLKKRGEVSSMRPNVLPSDATADDVALARAKEYYEMEPYPITKERIVNTKELFRTLNATEGFDMRNISNFSKHKDTLEIPGGLPKGRLVFEYEEYDVDTFEHLPKKIESKF